MKITLKYVGLLICVAHFGMLAIFNMAHVARGDIKSLFVRGLQVVRHCTVCSAYTTWTGLLGGYGFYSPSVGNTYKIQFARYKQDATTYHNSPGLKSQAAQMRFQSYLDIGSAILDTKGAYQTQEKKQAIASIQAACNYLFTRIPCDSLEAKLITKQISSLSQLSDSKPKHPIHLALYRYVQIAEPYP